MCRKGLASLHLLSNGSHYWEPIFAISNEPEFSGKTLYAIALAFTENKPFRVLFQGLGKAVAAEARNFRQFANRKIRQG